MDKNGGLSEENILKTISYFRDINLTWLFYGIGEMINANNQEQSLSIVSDTESDYKKSNKYEELKETIEILRDQVETLKDQLSESKKDKELLRKLLSDRNVD